MQSIIPKVFLAGLFSLTEKGYAKVIIEPGDVRLVDEPDFQNRTLSFHLKQRKDGLLPFEKKLVSWLFKEGNEKEQKFNLHEIAGPTIKEKNNGKSRKEYEQKQIDFESNHWNWYEDVKELMIDAGTFSDKISKIIKWTILILLPSMLMVGYLVDIQSGWSIATLLIISVIVFFYIFRGSGKAFILSILFFGFMLMSALQIVDDALSGAFVFLTCMSALLYYAIPTSIIVSINGFRTKRSILKFRNEIVRGIPEHLNKENQERWVTRAYLLNSSQENLPRVRGSQLDSLPLAKLFDFGKDPLYFVMKTWGSRNYPVKRSKGLSIKNFKN